MNLFWNQKEKIEKIYGQKYTGNQVVTDVRRRKGEGAVTPLASGPSRPPRPLYPPQAQVGVIMGNNEVVIFPNVRAHNSNLFQCCHYPSDRSVPETIRLLWDWVGALGMADSSVQDTKDYVLHMWGTLPNTKINNGKWLVVIQCLIISQIFEI